MEPSRQTFAHHIEALTYAPTGGIVAAVTTSLPERLGGVRNWDYRYCWLRDATFTLLAFMHLGYYEEARDWRDWLVRAVAGSPEQVQIVYGVGGERWLPELIVPWLPGYEKSSPVRIGNAAYQQLQIDVFGEIADAMLQNLKAGMGISERARALRSYWNTWPARGGSRTKAFGKCAADLSTSSIQRSWPGLHSIAPPTRWRRKMYQDSVQQWRDIADEIHADVCERGFDAELNSFVQSYGSKRVDASLLLISLVGFLPPNDPRIQGTIRAVEDKLVIDGEFVLRYETESPRDGLPEGEGAFLACSFWLVDNYILLGRYAEARKLFERLLSRCNDVGLLAEEFDPLTGRIEERAEPDEGSIDFAADKAAAAELTRSP